MLTIELLTYFRLNGGEFKNLLVIDRHHHLHRRIAKITHPIKQNQILIHLISATR
jgi:hypothetical protein